MAGPVMIECPRNVWTKVMEAVDSGFIHIKDKRPRYLHTFRSTGDPAPDNEDLSDAIPMYERTAKVATDSLIDVYIQPTGDDGEVRIDNL